MRVLPTGTPIAGATPSARIAASTAPVEAITVASVGPYPTRTLVRPAHRAANSADTRSAPTNQLRTPGTDSGSNNDINDGTTLATSTPASRIIADNARG